MKLLSKLGIHSLNDSPIIFSWNIFRLMLLLETCQLKSLLLSCIIWKCRGLKHNYKTPSNEKIHNFQIYEESYIRFLRWCEIFLRTNSGSCLLYIIALYIKKKSISALLTMPKPLTVWITINCGKFWKRWQYQTTWPASWETYMQVRKQQLELDMEQQTGSK